MLKIPLFWFTSFSALNCSVSSLLLTFIQILLIWSFLCVLQDLLQDLYIYTYTTYKFLHIIDIDMHFHLRPSIGIIANNTPHLSNQYVIFVGVVHRRLPLAVTPNKSTERKSRRLMVLNVRQTLIARRTFGKKCLAWLFSFTVMAPTEKYLGIRSYLEILELRIWRTQPKLKFFRLFFFFLQKYTVKLSSKQTFSD